MTKKSVYLGEFGIVSEFYAPPECFLHPQQCRLHVVRRPVPGRSKDSVDSRDQSRGEFCFDHVNKYIRLDFVLFMAAAVNICTSLSPRLGRACDLTANVLFRRFTYSPQGDRIWRLYNPGQKACKRQLYRAARSRLMINFSLYLDSAVLRFNPRPHT